MPTAHRCIIMLGNGHHSTTRCMRELRRITWGRRVHTPIGPEQIGGMLNLRLHRTLDARLSGMRSHSESPATNSSNGSPMLSQMQNFNSCYSKMPYQ